MYAQAAHGGVRVVLEGVERRLLDDLLGELARSSNPPFPRRMPAATRSPGGRRGSGAVSSGRVRTTRPSTGCFPGPPPTTSTRRES